MPILVVKNIYESYFKICMCHIVSILIELLETECALESQNDLTALLHRSLSNSLTLRGDKVTMLTDTYPHKSWGKLKWTYIITKLTAHYMCGLMSDLVIYKLEEYGLLM